MRISIVVLAFNQIEKTTRFWTSLIDRTRDRENTHVVVVDNGSTDHTVDYIRQNVEKEFRTTIIKNDRNRGVFIGYNQGWQCDRFAEIHAFLHNDLIIHELHWDDRVRHAFSTHRELGLVGFGGALEAGNDGGRSHFMSNLVDAHVHGKHIVDFQPCVLLDGMALIARETMLSKTGGFDESYSLHHFYDADLSLASIDSGFWNAVLPIRCEHLGGTTSLSVESSNSFHESNRQRYINKWRKILPRRVG
jgi:GT2 family glycosyltransferase